MDQVSSSCWNWYCQAIGSPPLSHRMPVFMLKLLRRHLLPAEVALQLLENKASSVEMTLLSWPGLRSWLPFTNLASSCEYMIVTGVKLYPEWAAHVLVKQGLQCYLCCVHCQMTVNGKISFLFICCLFIKGQCIRGSCFLLKLICKVLQKNDKNLCECISRNLGVRNHFLFCQEEKDIR